MLNILVNRQCFDLSVGTHRTYVVDPRKSNISCLCVSVMNLLNTFPLLILLDSSLF